MIVDSHAHWGPWFFSMHSESLQLNIRQLDRFGIDKQVVSAVQAIVYDPAAGNAALDRELDDAADPRLHGYVTIDPRDLPTAERDLDRLRPPRWVGVKIHSHYSRSPIGSPQMADAVRLATAAGLPVLLHTWGDDLLDLVGLADAVPGSRLLAGHMGAASWRRVPEVARDTDRVWFEPCWSQPEAGRIRWILDRIDSARLVFGTDATLIHPALAIGAIDAAAPTAAERTAIMGGTAAELFGFDVDPAGDARPSQ